MKLILSVLILFSSLAYAKLSPVEEENIYLSYQGLIEDESNQKALSSFGLSSQEQSLLVDALWDSLDAKVSKANIGSLKNTISIEFSLVEKLRLGILKLKYRQLTSFDESLLQELESELRKPEPEIKIIYILAAHEGILLSAGHQDLVALAKLHDSYSDVVQETEADSEIRAEVVTDLYHNTPDITTYMGGEYIKSVKIFMFCRQNRLYPCLMVMKDINGTNVRNSDGTLWSNQALASAVTGLPSFQRNGNTPAGIFTIDSVMPVADQQVSFGKFRRMMLNFVPKSNEETLIKSLLPQSSWDDEWWKATTVARDIGRNLFRIHGSGRINNDPNTPYFPFNRTLGCISQRENTYDGITYKGQRDLLDSIMKAMELRPIYENEPKIKGILYIMELEDKSSPVTLDELGEFGIR